MTITGDAEILQFPEYKVSLRSAFLRGLPSEPTRKVYGRVIKSFECFMDGKVITTATRRDVEAYRAMRERAGRANATIAKDLAALSGFFAFCVDEGVINRNPALSARRPKVSDHSPRKPLSRNEVQAILGACDLGTLIGTRDRAMVATLAVQGLRVSELLGLRVEDLGEEQGHKVAEVRGKGGKVTRVPLAAPVWQVVTSWLEVAEIVTGPVFAGIDRDGTVMHGKSISRQAAWARVRKLARRAGLTRPVHPHLFRHTAVTEALTAGVPLHQVQDFARHASPTTTRRYDGHRESLNNPACHVLAGQLIDV